MDFAKAEWEQFKNSKTVKLLIGLETAAIAAFITQVISGQVPMTLDSLKGWALVQVAIIFGFLDRHTKAGMEAKIDGAIDPSIVKGITCAGEKAFIERIRTKAPELAAQIDAHLNDKE